VDYALNLCVGCQARRFSIVADKPFDHAYDKRSCSVALDARAKGLLFNMILTSWASLPFKEGQARSFFPNIADLLYNGPA